MMVEAEGEAPRRAAEATATVREPAETMVGPALPESAPGKED
jgi:hypothetical protein